MIKPGVVERSTADDCNVCWAIVLAVTSCVLAEGDVELPVQSSLDSPMISCRFQQCLGCQLARQHKDANVAFGPAVNYPRRLDAAERFEAGELMIFGKSFLPRRQCPRASRRDHARWSRSWPQGVSCSLSRGNHVHLTARNPGCP